jgi:regulator of sigma E protease
MFILIFIITLLVLVVIHELGHFLAAKKFNIKVLEFGFGIPPRAWGKKIGETLVSVNWLPFGGFVRLLGEDETDKVMLDDKRSFAYQKVWKRIVVVVVGVVMNLVLAWVLF